ncbi:unnamed protein product [Ilex paraguariensis]|uniref:Alpha-carbonic anhydrase domain-containing protein n=1 Tax=Ilex paraguariensis TaxID=185542 RepID=A0ABC8TUV6_9AQUA
MAIILSQVALQIMGVNVVVSCSVASSLRLHSGMGLRDGKHTVPDKPFFYDVKTQLPVGDELFWYNGTAYPEPCIDQIQSGRKLRVIEFPFDLTRCQRSTHMTTYEWSLVEDLRYPIAPKYGEMYLTSVSFPP